MSGNHFKSTRHNTSQDLCLQQHSCKNLRSWAVATFWKWLPLLYSYLSAFANFVRIWHFISELQFITNVVISNCIRSGMHVCLAYQKMCKCAVYWNCRQSLHYSTVIKLYFWRPWGSHSNDYEVYSLGRYNAMQYGRICCLHDQKYDIGSRDNSKMSTHMYLTMWHYIPNCTYLLLQKDINNVQTYVIKSHTDTYAAYVILSEMNLFTN